MPEPEWYTVPSAVVQLTMRSDPATMTPSRSMRARETPGPGAEENRRTPIAASGSAARKPASAAEGNGTAPFFPKSYHVRTAAPTAQTVAKAPIHIQARRT